MTHEEMTRQLHESMKSVSVSSQLRRQTLDAMRRKEQTPIMKRKISAALVFALLIIAMCAVALAVAGRAGILDFTGRYIGSYVPEDAQSYVLSDVAALENELVTASVRELYYDGGTLRMAIDVAPKDDKTLLLGEDCLFEDRWQNLVRNVSGEWDENDTRTVWDVYHERGYTSALKINIGIAEEKAVFGTMDYTLGEDDVLTVFRQMEFEDDKPQRTVTLSVHAIPYSDVASNTTDWENRATAQQTLALTASAIQTAEPAQEGMVANTYVSVEPVVYESVGVRVDRLLIKVKPQEIYATLEYTVIDEEKYAATDDGLCFEFIDPQSTETAYSNQRLASGLTGGGGTMALGETNTRFRQRETLGRNELHETYTVRAYECWEKARFDTHEIAVRPATQADMETK